MTIAAVLQEIGSGIETIAAVATLFDAVRRLGEKRIGALPVVEDGRIVGMVSERDVIYSLREHGREALDRPVGEIMSSPAITVGSQTDVLSALARSTECRIS